MSHEQPLEDEQAKVERLRQERKELFEGLTREYIDDNEEEVEKKLVALDREINERTNAVARGDGPVSIRVIKPDAPPQQ